MRGTGSEFNIMAYYRESQRAIGVCRFTALSSSSIEFKMVKAGEQSNDSQPSAFISSSAVSISVFLGPLACDTIGTELLRFEPNRMATVHLYLVYLIVRHSYQ